MVPLDQVILDYLKGQQHADLTPAFENHIVKSGGAALPVCPQKSSDKLREFIGRLLNNNEEGMFFYRAEPARGLSTDAAIHVTNQIIIGIEHLQICIDSKILQLRQEFQAKLGWQIGRLYSRVGTKDWTKGELQAKVAAVAKNTAVWIPDRHYQQLCQSVKGHLSKDSTYCLSQDAVKAEVKTFPRKRAETIEAVVEVVTEMGFTGDVGKLRRSLEANSVLKRNLTE